MKVRIELRVVQQNKCPLYKGGERIVLEPPAVIGQESDAICAHALGSLYSWLEGIEEAIKRDPDKVPVGEKLNCFGCPVSGARASFQSQPAQPRESAKRAAEGAPPKTPSGESQLAVRILSSIPIFKGLSPEQLQRLVPAFEPRQIDAGTIFLEQGKAGEALYILVRGKVDILVRDNEGREKVVNTVGPGEVLGEMSLITGEPVSATARANTTVLALRMDKPKLDQVLQDFPSLSIHFIKIISDRLRHATSALVSRLEQGISGDLKVASLPEVVQAMTAAGKNGKILLEHADLRGEVCLRNQEVHSAKCGKMSGEEAFYEMCKWREGSFRFVFPDPAEPESPREIKLNTLQLLIRAAMQIDQEKAPQGSTPGQSPPQQQGKKLSIMPTLPE